MLANLRWRGIGLVFRPGHYLSHLLGHEGKGSLLSYLKAKGWGLALYAGGQSGEVGTYGFFKITVELSEQGLEHTDDIVEATFQYIAMLRATPIEEWVFEECRKLVPPSPVPPCACFRPALPALPPVNRYSRAALAALSVNSSMRGVCQQQKHERGCLSRSSPPLTPRQFTHHSHPAAVTSIAARHRLPI